MHCYNIALKVPHFTGSKQRKDDCFVVKVRPGEGYQLTNAVGEAYVDSHSMHYFLQWLQGSEREDLWVLASLDLKYLVMSTELHHILPEDCEQISLNESEGVEANHLFDYKEHLANKAMLEPWLYEDLKLKLPKLATRTDFSKWNVLEFDPFFVGVSGLQNPETAEISAVAWGYPIARGYSNLNPDFEYWHFEKVVLGRLLDRVNLYDPVFDATGLSIAELDRRAEESWKTFYAIRDSWQILDGEPSAKQRSAWARKVRDIDAAISIAIIAQFEARLAGQASDKFTEDITDFFLGIAFEKISAQAAPAAWDPEEL